MSSDAKPDKDKDKEQKKGGKKRLFMSVGVLVVALAGGGYWFMGRAKAAPNTGAEQGAEAEESEAAADEGEKGLIALDPFVVNLADDGGTHFLRTNIQLILKCTEKEAEALQEKKAEIMPIRSAVLELLAEQHAAELVTPEGKEKLKEAIRVRARSVFKKKKVLEVLFTEFVVQF